MATTACCAPWKNTAIPGFGFSHSQAFGDEWLSERISVLFALTCQLAETTKLSKGRAK
jgi:hypothetical protein